MVPDTLLCHVASVCELKNKAIFHNPPPCYGIAVPGSEQKVHLLKSADAVAFSQLLGSTVLNTMRLWPSVSHLWHY